jgi:hypothetical protein
LPGSVQRSRGTNCQVVIKLWQNWIKQEAKHYGLWTINSLFLLRIRNNCPISGWSLLLYWFTRMVIKLTIVLIVGYHCYQLHTKCYPVSSFSG